jgi:hypothetical protein
MNTPIFARASTRRLRSSSSYLRGGGRSSLRKHKVQARGHESCAEPSRPAQSSLPGQSQRPPSIRAHAEVLSTGERTAIESPVLAAARMRRQGGLAITAISRQLTPLSAKIPLRRSSAREGGSSA